MNKPSIDWQLCLNIVWFIVMVFLAYSSTMLAVQSTRLYLLVSSPPLPLPYSTHIMALDLITAVAQALGSGAIAVLLAWWIWRRTHPAKSQEPLADDAGLDNAWPPAPKQ